MRMDNFQTECLERIIDVRWQQHNPNKRVLEIEGVELENISGDMRRKR